MYSETDLSIRAEAHGCDYLSDINVITNSTVNNFPDTHFSINWATDEKIIIDGVEIDACHCIKGKSKKPLFSKNMKNLEEYITEQLELSK